MPTGNDFISTYKKLYINGRQYLAESFSRDKGMAVSDMKLIQGTALTQILDIGGVTESITVTAPLLVGGGSAYDGRTLITDKINEVLNETFAIPLLESASISISKDKCSANIKLISDGKPAPSVFRIGGAQQDGDALSDTYVDPTRMAKWYDFGVQVGKYKLYIESINVNITVASEPMYFMFSPEVNPNGQDLANNYGTQFPWIAVKSVSIQGGGKAAVKMSQINSDNYFDYYVNDTTDEAINVNLSSTEGSELSLQSPGRVNAENGNFMLKIWNKDLNSGNGDWEDLFTNIDLSNTVIKKANFSMPANDKMTVDFDFHCWVTKPPVA